MQILKKIRNKKFAQDFISEKQTRAMKDIKNEISVSPELVHDITINAGIIEMLKQQIENLSEKLYSFTYKI